MEYIIIALLLLCSWLVYPHIKKKISKEPQPSFYSMWLCSLTMAPFLAACVMIGDNLPVWVMYAVVLSFIIQFVMYLRIILMLDISERG
jgi:hypothetical protein